MALNTPSQAYRRYFNSLQAAVGCITHGRFTGRIAATPRVNQTYALVLNDGNPEPLKGRFRLAFSAGQEFRIIQDERADHGPYRATTIQYWYQFQVIDGVRLLTYHWTPETTDPGQRTYPHLHIESGLVDQNGPFNPDTFSKYHIPTERISIEAVVRFAIEELGVEPISSNWESVLNRGQEVFNRHRWQGGELREPDAER